MKLQFNRAFVVSGLIMLTMGLLAPLAHKHVAAPFGLLQAHLIGEVQALLFFCMALLWPAVDLSHIARIVAATSLQLGLWANMLGTLCIGILGTGREQYIVNQDKIPGHQGIWNDITNLLINLSAFVVVALILSLWGVLRRQATSRSDRRMDLWAIGLFALLSLVAILQTAFPEYSNF